jgi:hypothetical protein
MTSTNWGDAGLSRLASGYHRRDGKVFPEPRPDDGVFAAAGGLYTSMRDYARYMAFQLSAYADRSAAESGPLCRSSLREMHSGQAWLRWGDDVPVAARGSDGQLSLTAASYGFGWVNHTTCSYEGLVQHGGYEPGYFAYVRLLPKDGLGIVVFSTAAPIGDSKTFEGALKLLKEAGLLPRREPPSVALTNASGSVNRLLRSWDSRVVRDTFDPVSLKYSFLANLREDFAALTRDHGRCEPEGGVHVSSATQASWRVRCDRGHIRFSLALSPTAQPLVQLVQWKAVPAAEEGGGVSGGPTHSRTPGATCAE